MAALSIVGLAVIIAAVLIADGSDGDSRAVEDTPISGSGYERAEVSAALVAQYCTGDVKLNEASPDGFDVIQCTHADESPIDALVTFVVFDSVADVDAFLDRADRARTIRCDSTRVRGPQWTAEMSAADPERLYDLGGQPAAKQASCP